MDLNRYPGEELDDTPESSNYVDNEIEAILEWGAEGAGGGRFLFIQADDNSEARTELLRSNGYTVLSYEELPEEDFDKIIDLLDSAQSYGETGTDSRVPRQLPQGKIALIFNSKAWFTLARQKELHLAFNTSRAYMTLIGFASIDKNLD